MPSQPTLDVREMHTFEHGEVLVHAPDERGRRREQIEVRCCERLDSVGFRQRRVGVEPGPPLE
jgi:hypothetical protein